MRTVKESTMSWTEMEMERVRSLSALRKKYPDSMRSTVRNLKFITKEREITAELKIGQKTYKGAGETTSKAANQLFQVLFDEGHSTSKDAEILLITEVVRLIALLKDSQIDLIVKLMSELQ